MKRGRLQEGLLRFWCLKRIQEYDLVETGKVLTLAHLDDLVWRVPCKYDAFARKWIVK